MKINFIIHVVRGTREGSIKRRKPIALKSVLQAGSSGCPRVISE